MLSEYIQAALHKAKYKLLEDDTYFGEIQGFKGVWANAELLEDCREAVRFALEDWLVFSLQNGFKIPIVNRIDLNRRGKIKAHAKVA